MKYSFGSVMLKAELSKVTTVLVSDFKLSLTIVTGQKHHADMR